MPINTSGKNVMLDYLGTLCTHVALYSDAGGTTEIVGGSYARQSITWGAAAAGSKAITNQPVFQIPAGATVATIGVVTASSGGTQHALFDATDETYGGAGTYTITSLSISLT